MRKDSNYNVVLPNPPERLVIIIVGRNMVCSFVLFVEESLGCDVLGGDGTNPANSVIMGIRHAGLGWDVEACVMTTTTSV